MKVLVCEDDEMVLKMVEFKLEKEGYEVILAKDGKEAIDKIDKLRPDIIITDIMMPYLTGLEIVHQVRKQLNIKVPIIIVSSIGLEKTVLEAFQLGADDFITKPFSPNELSVRVKRLLMKSY
ncbi:MAG: response regulator transcription factor [Bacteroidetes bacterium]|jgi:DNA-binding response OmpR family regulator|nr:response regulator transcription factor [Bacteroidota bacterium]MBP6427527.1 response regulator transcription factor [Bacteroidia bacterium]MBK8363676.1 response regulator transcription factor [Bacteroidota bacterium]MBK9413367.1 response regulator transcription factor [Bacteroidota bacterium]MBL0032521.1 response regulator transcription factor [Bacteroidota bacterium]